MVLVQTRPLGSMRGSVKIHVLSLHLTTDFGCTSVTYTPVHWTAETERGVTHAQSRTHGVLAFAAFWTELVCFLLDFSLFLLPYCFFYCQLVVWHDARHTRETNLAI